MMKEDIEERLWQISCLIQSCPPELISRYEEERKRLNNLLHSIKEGE